MNSLANPPLYHRVCTPQSSLRGMQHFWAQHQRTVSSDKRAAESLFAKGRAQRYFELLARKGFREQAGRRKFP